MGEASSFQVKSCLLRYLFVKIIHFQVGLDVFSVISLVLFCD